MGNPTSVQARPMQIQAGEISLEGDLAIPKGGASGLVIFAHGSGSSRLSPRNRLVAETLNGAGLATLLFDLLTPEEQEVDQQTGRLRFNIDLLAERLISTLDWVKQQPELQNLRIGLFGASTGAAAALMAAAERPTLIKTVVSRGGRPDLAGEALPRVTAPTLLIVGGDDAPVVKLNQEAIQSLQATQPLQAEYCIEIVPGATHLFEELGKLEEVARLAGEWFQRHLSPSLS
ncbi:alpha/beta hydrolase [Nitrosococcus wardiae]|uniref:Alpha/beta hydrolase n=2 Tax=Nitrosococcus wardiae TaxID=1814290 RepID=A0A4P7BVE2_9GAMM|nr:alpha/beta hydrolase [Nitrosococcus wardiae]